MRLKLGIRIGNKGDKSDFERGVVVGARCQRRMARVLRADRKATLTQITTRFNQRWAITR